MSFNCKLANKPVAQTCTHIFIVRHTAAVLTPVIFLRMVLLFENECLLISLSPVLAPLHVSGHVIGFKGCYWFTKVERSGARANGVGL